MEGGGGGEGGGETRQTDSDCEDSLSAEFYPISITLSALTLSLED